MLHFQRYLYLTVGVVAFAGGVAAIASTLLTEGDALREIASLVIGSAGVLVGAAALRHTRRLKAKQHVGALDSGSSLMSQPFVLYLRSFTADDRQASPVSPTQFRTQEERLATVMSWLGRPVAVGSPEDRLPFAGFERIYVGDDWRTEVETLLRNAESVVLRYGDTSGLQWEAERTLELVPPERIVWVLDEPDFVQALGPILHAHGLDLPEPIDVWGQEALGSSSTNRIQD